MTFLFFQQLKREDMNTCTDHSLNTSGCLTSVMETACDGFSGRRHPPGSPQGVDQPFRQESVVFLYKVAVTTEQIVDLQRLSQQEM